MATRYRTALGLGLLLLGGCSPAPIPRTREAIFEARAEVPRLYLTVDTGARVIAPSSKGMHIDATTGEIAWPAHMCLNPSCPGRKENEPFLFIMPDLGMVKLSDGSMGYDLEKAKQTPMGPGGCPECQKIRKLESETDAERQAYINFVQPYVLPETAEKLRQLDDELKRRVEWEKNAP